MAQEQRGALLLYIVAAIVVFSILAGVMASHYSVSTRATAHPDCQKAARLMAESGIRYAMGNLRAAVNSTDLTSRVTALDGNTYTLNDGASFTLDVTNSSGSFTVSSSGSSPCAGAESVNASLSKTFSVDAASNGPITFDDGDLYNFTAEGSFSASPTIVVDPVAGTISMGGNLSENSGAVWYTGTKRVCTEGNCTLGNGLRAYFEFVFESYANADGFVWALISGETNNLGAGGDKTMGELLGYGGLGASRKGLQAPKLGLEFDIFRNDAKSCNCEPGSRNDRNGSGETGDHIAFIYWGRNVNFSDCDSNSSTSVCDKTYDDNRHGAGTSGSYTEPLNPANSDGGSSGADGYYYQTGSNSWLQAGGKYRLRYELTRHTAAAANGQYCYELRAWLRSASEAMPTGLDDVSADYEPMPDLQTVLYLSPAMHANLGKIFFGWTEGTGYYAQIVTLSKFALDFKPDPGEPRTMPTATPVGYWSMYNGQGTTVSDRSAQGNHGTINDSATVNWVPGVGCPDCPALNFTGGFSSYVNIPDDSSLDLRDNGTAAAWVMIPSTSIDSGATILRKGSASTAGTEAYRLYLSNRRPALYVRRNSFNTRTITASTALEVNRWYHIAATWTQTALQLYVDGVLVQTGTGVNTLADTGGPVLLGHRTTSANPFTGNIDEVLLYDSVLTATQIQQLYQYGLWGRQ